MSARLVVTASLAVTAAVLSAGSATAQPIDKGHFHDTTPGAVYNCDGTRAQDTPDVYGNFVLNLRGSGPFPYYLESLHGSVVTTNLKNGGTFTNVFAATTKDQTITDIGHDTIRITSFAAGGSRFYDTHGNFVLKDPGEFRSSIDVKYHGTPGNPDDDTVVDGSFRVVRASTGHSDFSTRDFCADLVQFTK